MIAVKFIEHDETLPWHVVVCFGGGKEANVLLEHRVSTNGHCMALRKFGVMPLFDCKLAVANVDVRADDCTAEFITGGVYNQEEQGCMSSDGGAFEGNESWRVPESGITELWMVQEFECELVEVGRRAISSMCWYVGQLEGGDCGAVQDDEVLGATHHF